MCQEVEKNISENIFDYMLKMKKLNLFELVVSDISQAEFMMLKLIKNCAKSGPVTVSVLGERLDISKSAVSQMLNALEDRGLARRFATRDDRRVSYVELTQEGQEILKKVFSRMNQMGSEILSEMGEEDIQTMIRLLEKMYFLAKKYKEKQKGSLKV